MYIERPLPPSFTTAIELRLACRLDTPHASMLSLLRAARGGGLHFVRSPTGVPIASVAFARVDADTLRQVGRRRVLPRYEHEWSSGPLCLIFDVVILRGWSKQALRGVRAFLRSQRFFAYLRGDRLESWVRRGGRFGRLGGVH